MESSAPEKYDHPFWGSLSDWAEAKVGIPDNAKGILKSILLNGEKSNNSAVSSAGAKTVYQIIPSTRDAVLKKYGIDAYSSPQSAALSAAYLLKEGLDRNNQDVRQAVGEYAAGTDRNAWGPKTMAYLDRVVPNKPAPTSQGLPENSIRKLLDIYKSGGMDAESAKAFEEDVNAGKIMLPVGTVLKEKPVAPSNQLRPEQLQKLSDLYASGQLPDDAKNALEEDIRDGLIKLPPSSVEQQAAQAAGTTAQPPAVGAPGVTMLAGRPLGERLQKITHDFTIAPQIAANAVGQTAAGLMGTVTGGLAATGEIAKSIIDGSFGSQQAQERAQKAMESNLNLANQAYSNSIGALLGANNPEIAEATNKLSQAASEIGMGAIPLTSELNAYSSAQVASSRLAKQARAAISQSKIPTSIESVLRLGEKTIPPDAVMPSAADLAELYPGVPEREALQKFTSENRYDPVNQMWESNATPPPAAAESSNFGARSVGAGENPITLEQQRYEKAKNLEAYTYGGAKAAGDTTEEFKLTQPELTRDPTELGWQKKTMMLPEGEDLRQHMEDFRRNVNDLFTQMDEKTGARTGSETEAGHSVKNVIINAYEKAKKRTRNFYEAWYLSPESKVETRLDVPVVIDDKTFNPSKQPMSLIDWINKNPRGQGGYTDAIDNIVNALTKRKLAVIDNDGNLVPTRSLTTGEVYELQKQISDAQSGATSPKIIREFQIIKKSLEQIIDNAYADKKAPLLDRAKRARRIQGIKFENKDIIASLWKKAKGLDDPMIEDSEVFKKAIEARSPEEITWLKRVLNTSGETGKQAWRELEGVAVREMRSQTELRNKGQNEIPGVSPFKLNNFIRNLDRSGKLDVLFGKERASILRDLNDVVGYVVTVTPETLVNTSGSALMLMGAAESVMNGITTSFPVPVLTILKIIKNQVNSQKIRAKITRVLNYKPGNKE